jgi:hypothetical protein
VTKDEKKAADEQLARNRTVRGWVFRNLPEEEAAAIQAFVEGGPVPEKYAARYQRERELLKLA